LHRERIATYAKKIKHLFVGKAIDIDTGNALNDPPNFYSKLVSRTSFHDA
jgi:hypothetical protein